jgi:hypothetical protein
MEKQSYTISSGWYPNPVFEAAKAYLDAAESEYSRALSKTGFLEFQNWFVVHHLTVIATELFVKSFLVTVTFSPVTREDGPSDEVIEHAYNSHKTSLDKLDPKDKKGLEDYLSDPLFALLKSASNAEISRGRYPYENDNGSAKFPKDDEEGKKLVDDWLMLARALSKYDHPA